MQRLLELIFGVQRSASDPGTDQSVGFNPPTWMGGHAPLINALLVIAALAIVVLIYRRESRRTSVRVGLGALRLLAFAYVIMLLNRPVLRVTETYTEPSVLAVLIDDSISMTIRDVDPSGVSPSASSPTTAPTTAPSTQPGAATLPAAVAAMNIGGSGPTRLEAAIDLLNGQDQALLRRLGQTHTVRVYGFDKDARAIGSTAGAPVAVDGKAPPADAAAAKAAIEPKLVEAIGALRPEGRSTQVVPSLLTVLDDLQGQRLAGVVIITDARETPTAASPALIDKLKKYNAKIYPVAVGSEESPTNVELVALSMQDSAFKDDLVSAKLSVRGTGYAAGHPVRLRLKNIKTGAVLRTGDGRPAEVDVKLPDANPLEAEIVFKPEDVGALDVAAEAELQAGELDDKDNVRIAQVAVLDAQINVLYVEDYPRWEYRYIKNEMIRDRTVNVSCLLLGADERFAQEGDRPDPDLGDKNPETGSKFPGAITRFPERMEELMKYDVVLLGDVDARKLTDAQLQMIGEFVNKKGGGFGMVAGPRHAPIAYRNTAIEAVLPVTLTHVQPEDPSAEYREGWRPIITDEGRRGEASTIFRFFEDRVRNDEFLRSGLQPLFWFCQGVAVKQGAGLVYAEHPMATDPTGRKAPILVLGRFGAGRTLFSAIDDSWRWRYYTGEPVFDNYWVQQLRYLARSRKLGQRKVRFSVDRSAYELGERVQVDLKVLDPVLLTQLPPQLRVDVLDDKGQLVRQESLARAESPADLYALTFTADAVGRYTIKLSQTLGDAKEAGALELPIEVVVPRLELAGPELDRAMLSRLAPPEQIVPIAEARAKLPEMIKSAARTRAETTPVPLWDRWRALWIFAGLLTAEWVLRKVFGMI